MSGGLARKLKRTKREQLMSLESINKDAIKILINQDQMLAEEVNALKKQYMAMYTILKSHRLIDDFIMSQTLKQIEEMEEMNKKAIILGNKKP
jgi:hypothetical protein